jgi:hypothetical protein
LGDVLRKCGWFDLRLGRVATFKQNNGQHDPSMAA